MRVPILAALRAPPEQFAIYATSSYNSLPSCKISTVLEIDPNASHFQIQVKIRGRRHSIATAAMVDCGATALFLGNDFVKRHNLRTTLLRQPINIFNIDGTPNWAGQITHFACLALTVDDQEHWTDFLVTNLGGEDIILGLPWLWKINPEVDWEKGWLSVKTQKVTIEDVPEDTEGLESGRVAAVTTDRS